jgi:DNA-directed RNA polymerase subunit L
LSTPRPTNVELAEKYQIAKNAETAQNVKSKFATYTWINILKNICAKSKKIAAEVYSVEVEIEE